MDRFDVLVAGAGHSGAQTAIALRQRQFGGSIAIIGDEQDLPYERPPLSKDFLAGDKMFERLLIRPASFWAERSITMLLGEAVVSVDAAARRVAMASGRTISYDQLVWAAGARPRRLACSGHDLPGVHAIRNRADVESIKAELAGVARVVVIGGGYIGLEAAAILAKMGRQVTVLEAQDRVLARVAGERLSRFFEAEHRAQGVSVVLNAQLAGIVGDAGRAAGVRLADGSVIAADMVIVGIGILPNIEELSDTGAVIGNGVQVDHLCRTGVPGIWAVGDCALHANRFAADEAIRLESVQNANDMAATVAKALTGTPEPYDAVPWFWSNQYDLRLQTVGLSVGHDAALVRGDPATRSFSVVYLKQGKIIALDCVNAVKDFVQGRALVTEAAQCSATVDLAALVDPAVPLKSLANATVQPTS